MSQEQEWFTIQEFADLFRINHKTVRKAITEGAIEVHKIGYCWRIHKSEIERIKYKVILSDT